MKRLWAGAVAVVLLGAAAYVALTQTDSAAGVAPVIGGAPPSAATLARGEYLATAADCVACHTNSESGRRFAGGVAFKLPVGTIYSSNISADPTTGIGGWTDDEFVRAVRDGVGRQGEHLYPAFPYTSYTGLSRPDVLAIKAYLLSLPPVKQANRANDLKFPFNQRWAVGLWNAAFFKDRRFEIDPSKSPAWNSGAYLATALGHCGECHTPRNLAFGLEHSRELAGAELLGWRAYNITSDPHQGIGGWNDAALTQYLATGLAAGLAVAGGPMGEAVGHSLQYLNRADIAALVVYLRSVPAHAGEPPSAAATVATASRSTAAGAQSTSLGSSLFAGACASCHELNGAGRESPYAALVDTRGVNDVSGTNVTQAILRGAQLRLQGHDVVMPSFGAAYSDTEVAALSNYVIAQFGGKVGTVTPKDVAQRRQL